MATQLWGCDSLTWDMQFDTYVSPHAEDVENGSAVLAAQLAHIADGSVILLDEFSDSQQSQILAALETATGKDWIVITSDTSRKSTQALHLARMGQRWGELGGGHRC